MNFIAKNINTIGTIMPEKSVEKPNYIAIIGGGPKGLYAFERLMANLAENPPSRKTEIHIFNKTPNFGAGEIYAPSQPDYLMINFCIGNIDMWIDEEPQSVSPETLSLTEWLKQKVDVTELDYAPRGVVGQYLIDGFNKIVDNLPENVSVRKFVGEITDIEKCGSEFELRLKDKDGERFIKKAYQNVLLTTGHSSRNQSETEKKYQEFTERFAETSFVPFVYPVENLEHIPPKSTVAIKGMGLTFVDTVLALTVGRGGEFKRKENGEVTKYIPSGKEPNAIYAFSRSSMPILPRGAFCGEPNFKLRYFTEEKIEKLKQNSENGKVDFTNELWNLVELEMTYTYYRVLMKNKEFDFNVSEDFKAKIETFHKVFPDEERFSLEKFFNPLLSESYNPESHQKFIENYIEKAISEARLGEDQSPFMAVVAVWREITPIFGKFYQFGGLTPDSHKDFLQNFFGTLCRITFGPPIESIEKILAISKAGILKFEIGAEPEVSFNKKSGKFEIKSEQNGFKCEAEHLIDARIPKKKIPTNASPLYKNLFDKGLIRTFENEDFDAGCVDISRSGNVIDANGNETENLSAYGTPTEGITFDNDSLSRQRNNFASIWAKDLAKKVSAQN